MSPTQKGLLIMFMKKPKGFLRSKRSQGFSSQQSYTREEGMAIFGLEA